MNKLKIPNPEALDMGDMFAIPNDRRESISEGLNEMVRRQSNSSQTRLVYASDVLRYIESLCETDEERIWAIALHLSWNLRTGRMAATEKKQNEFIKAIGKPERL